MGEVYVPTRVKRRSRAILLVASEAKQRSKRSERLGSLFPKDGADKDAEHLPWDANGENSGTARVELYGNGEKKYGFYFVDGLDRKRRTDFRFAFFVIICCIICCKKSQCNSDQSLIVAVLSNTIFSPPSNAAILSSVSFFTFPAIRTAAFARE